MTRKEKIIAMVQRFGDNATFDEVIYRLHVLQSIEQGLEDIAAGRVKDHDEFMAELEDELVVHGNDLEEGD